MQPRAGPYRWRPRGQLEISVALLPPPGRPLSTPAPSADAWPAPNRARPAGCGRGDRVQRTPAVDRAAANPPLSREVLRYCETLPATTQWPRRNSLLRRVAGQTPRCRAPGAAPCETHAQRWHRLATTYPPVLPWRTGAHTGSASPRPERARQQDRAGFLPGFSSLWRSV